MTETTNTTDTPCAHDARYHIQPGKEVLVDLQLGTLDSNKPVKAELVHISPVDASLQTKTSIDVKGIVGLTLRAKHPEHTISVSGEVCWVVPNHGRRWWVGCSFKPPIPPEVLEQFAEGGVLERRQYARQSVSVAAAAKWELDQGTVRAEIVDLSQGGFCLRSPVEGKPGERILLQLRSRDGQERFVPAKAQWQVENQRQFVVGCQFVDPDGYHALSDAVDFEDLTIKGAFSVWRWLGGALTGNRSSE
jgi:hypothetical protein